MNKISELLIDRIGSNSILEFSKKHGLSHQTLRSWISGQRKINIDGLRLLAQAFPRDEELLAALRIYWIGLLEDAIRASRQRRKSGTVTTR